MNLALLEKCELLLRLLVRKRIKRVRVTTGDRPRCSEDIDVLLKEVQECIKETALLAYRSDELAVIEEWFSTGNLVGSNFDRHELGEELDDDEEPPSTVQQLYEAAGNILDDANSSDLFGHLVFRVSNGKFYTMSVEAVISEAHPEDVRELQEAKTRDR